MKGDGHCTGAVDEHDMDGKQRKTNEGLRQMKKNPFLTDSEIRALGVALGGGVFDEIRGAAVRKNWLLEEASMMLEDEASEDEEAMYDLEGAMQKVEALSDDQVDELVRLVNAHYRIVVNETLYQVAQGKTCICDDCRRRAGLN